MAIGPVNAVAAPLTIEQQIQAEQLANAAAWQRPEESETPNGKLTQVHPLGLQTLSIEPDVTKNGNARSRVRVYQFSYALSAARLVIVSLDKNEIIKETPVLSAHLPLNSVENQAALTVLSTDPEAITVLQAEQQRRGFQPFSRFSELSVKASIFKPIDATHPCANQRCALLSLFDKSNTVFAMEPIVNLQSGALSWLNR